MNVVMIVLTGILAFAFVALIVIAIIHTAKKKKAKRLWLGAGLCVIAVIPVSIAGSLSIETAAPAATPPVSVLARVKALAEDGEYTEAASVLLGNNSKREVLWPDIARLFEGHMDALDIELLYYSPLPGENDMEAAEELDAILKYKMPDYRASFMDRVPPADILEYSSFSLRHDHRFSPQEAIGAEPSGKMLIYQMNDAGGAPSYADARTIQLGAAALLDDRYIPERLAQVQYLLILNYDLEYYGTYENAVVGSKVIATVQLFEYPGERMIYDFGRIEGGNPPRKIPDHTDKVVRGSYPEQEEVTNLLLEAIELINEEPSTVFGS